MLNSIEDFLVKYHLEKSKIIVGFSGGKDSLALLNWLYENGSKYQIQLGACHIHHGIRGNDADEDLSFCKNFCEERNIPFFEKRIDTVSYAKKEQKSLETSARILRYECFETIAREQNAYIATAHTQNDQVETILFRMARGTGLKGLSGIPEKRGIYLRPLLKENSESIISYCEEKGLKFRTDRTNFEDDYSRNYIRHHIISEFETINPKFLQHISDLSSMLLEDEDYLNEKANELLKMDNVRGAISSANDAIAKRAIRNLYEPKQVSEDAITILQVEKILGLIRSSKKHGKYDLPSGISFQMEGNWIRFEKNKNPSHYEECELHMGMNDFPNRGCAIYVSQMDKLSTLDSSKYIYNLLTQSKIFFDTINPMLLVKTKKEGDTCYYGGMTHKLKKLFNDKKISLEERNRLPIVWDEEEIVWVPGFSPREPKTNDTIPLYFYYFELGEKHD